NVVAVRCRVVLDLGSGNQPVLQEAQAELARNLRGRAGAEVFLHPVGVCRVTLDHRGGEAQIAPICLVDAFELKAPNLRAGKVLILSATASGIAAYRTGEGAEGNRSQTDVIVD